MSNMTQSLFPSTIGKQSRSAKFLTIKTVVKQMSETRCSVCLGPIGYRPEHTANREALAR